MFKTLSLILSKILFPLSQNEYPPLHANCRNYTLSLRTWKKVVIIYLRCVKIKVKHLSIRKHNNQITYHEIRTILLKSLIQILCVEDEFF